MLKSNKLIYLIMALLIAIIVSCFIIVFIHKNYIISNEYSSKESRMLEKNKDILFSNIKTHQKELDKFINTIYNKNEEAKIYHFEDVDDDVKKFIDLIKVDWICLYKDEYGNKILDLHLKTDGKYEESIFYCDHEVDEFNKCYEKIISKWYYNILFYT